MVGDKLGNKTPLRRHPTALAAHFARVLRESLRESLEARGRRGSQCGTRTGERERGRTRRRRHELMLRSAMIARRPALVATVARPGWRLVGAHNAAQPFPQVRRGFTEMVRPVLRARKAAIKLTPAAANRIKVTRPRSIARPWERLPPAPRSVPVLQLCSDQLTGAAIAMLAAQELLGNREEPALGIRLGIRQRGCNGLTYTMDYAEKKEKFQEVSSGASTAAVLPLPIEVRAGAACRWWRSMT